MDRIGITVVISGQNLYKHVYGQFYSMRDEQKQLLPEGKIKIRQNKYSMRLDYYAAYTHKKAGRRKIADITLGANKLPGKLALHRYMTLTLYPSQFQDGEFDHFKSVFDMMFDPIMYPVLFQTGKVNYLELAADSLSHNHHSFLPYRKYVTKSDIYKKGDSYLGTTYLGSNTSGLRFRLYDKAKQLNDTGKSTFTKIFPHTRIEAVMRRLGVAPVDLIKMKNPFKKMLIADLAKAQSACADEEWQNFMSESQQEGVPAALSKLPANKRKKYLGMLDDMQVPWWNPDEVWKELPLALSRIEP
ncbi:replication initiation factor domain-containing protein [Georgfuchsia toluolica]|uniref:replication initiation factor domain-containing protein n=1 Tax=Georgfuchsia toluolica TaxID=424218 RepID=UPI001C730A85|nr:replication initiation factor domain-containing protein [Georgfuchsia toluolica]